MLGPARVIAERAFRLVLEVREIVGNAVSLGVTGTGWWHSTGNVLDPAAKHGTLPGDIIVTNAAATDAPFQTLSGDLILDGTADATVVGIQHVTVIAAAPNVGDTFVYDGTLWNHTPLNALLGVWNNVDKVHADSPVALTAAQPLVAFSTAGGTIQFLTPPAPFNGMVIGVKPTTPSATPATLHAQNGGGETVENPVSSGSFGTDGAVPGQGPAVYWKYRATDKKWIGFINV
jgi:hypothetical protein